MRVRVAIAAAVALAALAVGLAGGTASASGVPSLDWTSLLPPLPSATEPQPHPVAHCRRATIACIEGEIRRMKRLRSRLGCDHRAVFDTTYLELTKTFRRAL